MDGWIYFASSGGTPNKLCQLTDASGQMSGRGAEMYHGDLEAEHPLMNARLGQRA